MSKTFEVRQNTGARSASTGEPEIGRLISKHRTLNGAVKSRRKYAGLHVSPILWVREGDSLRLTTEAEGLESLAY